MMQKYQKYLEIFKKLSDEEKKNVIIENMQELKEYLSSLTFTESSDFSYEDFYEEVILNLITIRELNAMYINQINN